MTIRSADSSKPVDRLTTLDDDFDQASVSRLDRGLETHASGSSAELVDNQVLQQQLEPLGFLHAHCGIFQLRGSKIKTAEVDRTETRISPSPASREGLNNG